ncbi:MAG TPA: superoxide dismutase family protein [Lacipirellulaceae bacterium]|jgi:Cu-Zn family superoxide dismutase|nr:superoxide dismutase family protein [Lacipirellulaceae bacterium]
MRNRTSWAVVASLAIAVAGISYHTAASKTGDEKSTASHAMESKVTMAVAMVEGLGEHKVKGKVTFTQKGDGLEIKGEFTGLQPGQHGFHIHEFGDCSMADGKCAGGHFNPNGGKHSSPDDPKRHAGDLGNLKADSTGNASFEMVDKMLSLSGENSVIGRSVIIHAKADDLKTQPSGDSGDRIGCGVIGIADPKVQGMH